MDPTTPTPIDKRIIDDEPYPGHNETNAKYMEDAMKIHSKYPLLDGHNDSPFALRTCFDTKWSNDKGDCPWQCLPYRYTTTTERLVLVDNFGV
jgi:hypothetical protein